MRKISFYFSIYQDPAQLVHTGTATSCHHTVQHKIKAVYAVQVFKGFIWGEIFRSLTMISSAIASTIRYTLCCAKYDKIKLSLCHKSKVYNEQEQ